MTSYTPIGTKVPGNTLAAAEVNRLDVAVASLAGESTAQVPTSRLGSGTPGAGRYVDGATGAWTDLPTGGGGGAANTNVYVANADQTWPSGMVAGTASKPTLLFANLQDVPDAQAYPAPPLTGPFDFYYGPTPVAQMPTVIAEATSQTGRTVTFLATPSPTPETSVQDIAWTFSDGGTATGATPTHTFADAGAQWAKVTTTDSNNIKANHTLNLTLTEGIPTVTARGVVDGMDVTWTAEATDPEGEALTYAWTGTDALTGTASAVTKTYETTGAKSATVTVTDSKGQTATASATVTIAAPVQPGAAFTSDTFTTASTDVLNRDTELMVPGEGTSVKPLAVNQPARVSVASGRLKLDTAGTNNVSVTYPNSAADPKVAVTIAAHTGDPLFRFTCYWNGTQSVYALFEQGGKISWGRYDGTNTTNGVMQASGAWASGDRVELTYIGTAFRVLVTRAGATFADLTATVTRPSPVASSQALVRQDKLYQTVELDDLWVGSA